MPEKHLNEVSQFEWLTLTLVAFWAALSAFLTNSKVKKKSLSLMGYLWLFFHDLILSGGFTYLTYMVAVGYGLPDTYGLPLAGFIGHKATRFSYLIELLIETKIKKAIGVENEDNKHK